MPKVPTQLIGESPAFIKTLDESAVAAVQDTPVLLYGETGSGKGIVAEYIHIQSKRGGRLVSLNCSTFQPNLFESELFGYVKGSFTGALKDTPGLFETADNGTLFLDEIGDMPLELQPKLLRALEEGVIRRVGGTKEIEVDVRLVCATNRDLAQLIDEGLFREDLYYRINSFVINLPSLRERKHDIAGLAHHFLRDLHRRSDDSPPKLSVEAIETLQGYAWPGNVRELRSAMNYANAQAAGRKTILVKDLPSSVTDPDQTGSERPDPNQYLERFRELYLRGVEDRELWASFLLAFNTHLGSNKFSRGDVLDCLRDVRGPEPTNNSLVNEWQRHIKPVPLRFGLVSEEGKKLRINVNACETALAHQTAGFDLADDNKPDDAGHFLATPPPIRERSGRTNIDAARTSFVGREPELNKLTELIKSGQHNLITVTGPGGTGKTRLSREAGRRLTGDVAGGIWFADLTDARDVEGVAYAVAQAVGVPLTGKQSPELSVADILAARPNTLIILDNFEQVAEVASPMISQWASGAPQVCFVVTSRFLLGIEDEREFTLEALRPPEPTASLAELRENEAVKLFADRARVHHVGFELNEASTSAVAEICRHVEGMPLAIELAAARTVIMKPEHIANRLDRVFDLLKSSRRDLAPRQQSLQATLDWSFDLLNDVERWAFAQLSVFKGGFFLESAESVLDLSRFTDPPEPLDIIQSLREKSLLLAFETPYETRFAMYQLIRDYAADKWQAMASDLQRTSVEQRHASYMKGYVHDWAERVFSRDAVEALDRLDLARRNVAGVLEWCFERRDEPEAAQLFVDLTLQMANTLRVRGPANARAPSLRRALALVGDQDSPSHVRLLFSLSSAERESGDASLSSPLAQQALDMAQRLGDEELIANALFNKAGLEIIDGDSEAAQELHMQALPVFKKVGNRLNYGRCFSRMAVIAARRGNFEQALEWSNEAEKVLRDADDLSGLAFMLHNRGNIFLRRQDPGGALTQWEQSEALFREMDDKRMIAISLANRALMTRNMRRMDEAVKLAEESTGMMRELGDRLSLAQNLMNTGILHMELANYDQAGRHFDEGRQLFHEFGQHGFEGVCLENLALILSKDGEIEAALKQCDNALELADDGDSELSAGIRNTKSEILIAAERFDEALPLAASAVAVFEGVPSQAGRDGFRALTSLALASAGTGDNKGAKVNAERAIQLAAELGYSSNDPSPQIRTSLTQLESLTS